MITGAAAGRPVVERLTNTRSAVIWLLGGANGTAAFEMRAVKQLHSRILLIIVAP